MDPALATVLGTTSATAISTAGVIAVAWINSRNSPRTPTPTPPPEHTEEELREIAAEAIREALSEQKLRDANDRNDELTAQLEHAERKLQRRPREVPEADPSG